MYLCIAVAIDVATVDSQFSWVRDYSGTVMYFLDQNKQTMNNNKKINGFTVITSVSRLPCQVLATSNGSSVSKLPILF